MSIFKYITLNYYKEYRESFFIIRKYDERFDMTRNDKIIFIFILLLILLLTFNFEINILLKKYTYNIIDQIIIYFQNIINLLFKKDINIIKNIDDGKNTENINNIKEIFSLLDN